MKKYLIAACSALLLFASCAQEFNNVYKSNDYLYKYEYAKEAFANGKYNKAITILQSIVTQQKGTKDAEDCLYMLAMSEYMIRDYATASEYFKKYYQSYPKGAYAEQAEFYVGESLYMSTPEPRLDQTPTYSAIAAYQEYLDLYPDGSLKEKAQSRLFELQDKLVEKEYLSAKLYYDLGDYFGNCTNGGNNYQACVVTAQNAVNDYPYSSKREEFYILIMKSKYELARMSVMSATDLSTSSLIPASAPPPRSISRNARNTSRPILLTPFTKKEKRKGVTHIINI